MNDRFGDVGVVVDTDFVATLTICRPPNNFFDVDLIRCLADAYEAVDAEARCRAIVLCSEGRHFCAGADFGGRSGAAPITHDDPEGSGGAGRLYYEAGRLFATKTPVVAAVQGAAIGGGLGLACSADFRVGCPEARFAANFARLGFHHGFGLSVTLPPIVGQQRCLEMLYSGRRISGEEAGKIGLCDRIVDQGELSEAAHTLAAELAAAAPLAVESIRLTMREGLADRIRAAMARELREQERLRLTADWAEGVAASAERRQPRFEGR